MGKLKYYIDSFRLRTLPLSVSGILTGSLLALSVGAFDVSCFVLAVVTTLCLQILSNLANEWGDLQKGTDNEDRLGPIRSVQAGALTLVEFRRVIVLFVLLSLVFGSVLVYRAFGSLLGLSGLMMLLAGGLAVVAAIKYTVGRHAYGYRGLGDLFVFVFFGWLSTVGAWFLMTHAVDFPVFLPATSVGLLSVGVLNLNNMRDVDNDARCGKRTIPVIIGSRNARFYHTGLIIGAIVAALLYAIFYGHGLASFAFLLTFPLLGVHLRNIFLLSGRALDAQLKFLSLTTLAFALLVGIGQLF